jgi:hypothetical protein
VRLPAQEIEDLILAELTRLLGSQQQLLDLLSDSCASESDRQRLLEGIQSPRDLKGTSHAELQSLIHRVLVHDDSIEVQVRKGALLKLVLGQIGISRLMIQKITRKGTSPFRSKHNSNAAGEKYAFCYRPTRHMPNHIPFLRSSVLWPAPMIG